MSSTNTLDPIFEAIGGIDDDIAAEALKAAERKRKPIKLIVLGAIAAALIAMGCSAAVRSSMKFDDNPVMEFNYYAQTEAHILTAEELESLGAVQDERASDYYTINTLPSELFAHYNITPLISSEHFREKEAPITVILAPRQGILRYAFTDIESGKQINFQSEFYNEGELSFDIGYQVLGEGSAADIFSHHEFIKLADGSEAFVADRYLHGYEIYTAEAVLCHNGIAYRINARDTDINAMKRILEKLGAL